MQRVIAFLALFSASLLQQCGSVEVTLGQPILRDKFENPQNQIVNRGSRVNLTCGPLVNDFAAQVWSYVNDRNEPLFISTSIAELGYELERINVPGFGVRTNLIISSVDDNHETFYQCVAIVNSTTRYYSAGAQLIIFEPADVRFHKDTPLPDGIFTAAPGASAVLGIEVSGKPAPQLTLLKESSGTSTTVTDPRFSVNASEIRISTVKMEDGGKYRLVVNNSRAEGRSVALQFEIYVEGGGWNPKVIDKALETTTITSKVCPGTVCPAPTCANPKYESNSCCPTCQHSSCKLEGCVEYSDVRLGSKWHPDPCSTCYCIMGRPICIKTHCPTLECPEYQIVHKTGKCCPSCDYSKLAVDMCNVVEDEMVNITIQDSRNGVLHGVTATGQTGLCTLKVVKHRCDRQAFKHHGHMFICKPQTRKRHVSVGNVCGLEHARIAFRDVMQCSPRLVSSLSVRGGSEDSNEYCNMFFPTSRRLHT